MQYVLESQGKPARMQIKARPGEIVYLSLLLWLCAGPPSQFSSFVRTRYSIGFEQPTGWRKDEISEYPNIRRTDEVKFQPQIFRLLLTEMHASALLAPPLSCNDGDDGLPSNDGVVASNPLKTMPTRAGICSFC